MKEFLGILGKQIFQKPMVACTFLQSRYYVEVEAD